jgi:2-dehydro-3-deoxyphosphogluconate aldolase/(4S)-4-hydroxy-2-oxoglutarate aldolase
MTFVGPSMDGRSARTHERLRLRCAHRTLAGMTASATFPPVPSDLRHGSTASLIRAARLVVVLRRVTPRERLLSLVEELAEAGVRVFEVTFDAPAAADDLAACRRALDEAGHEGTLIGAGTVRTLEALADARAAGAAFAVAPVLDPEILGAALHGGLPFIPGAYTPTEIDRAWRLGATFVKLFPGSSLGPGHVRELRGPLPEVEAIVTGGVDATNAAEFLDAGAVAVGIGGAIVRATPEERRALVSAIRAPG